jgi:2-keto-4-pentenoate hydratase
MPETNVAAAAEWIAAARLGRRSLVDMPTSLKPATEDDGYRVQFAVHQRLCAAGRGPVFGWKVGVTTPQMRAALGIDAPIGGAMLAAGRLAPGATIPHSAYARVGIECEIAVVLKTALGGPGMMVDLEAAAAAVGTLHPAIEIVDDRYGGDYRRFGVPAIVADDAFHAGFVLGPAVPNWQSIDLRAVRGVTRAGGIAHGEGRGADVQGHPLTSLAWIANRLGALGRRCEAGQIISTGSLPLPYWAAPGDAIEIEIEHIGSVSLTMS